MVNFIVDGSLCTGCGLCVSNCPEVFEIKDDGIAHVKGKECDCDPKELIEQCPVSAISVK